jgi:MraZ protein
VFLGEYQHTIDTKGRVVLPARFRERLAEGCVVTKGQERCLYVFPIDRWEDEVTKVSRLPRTDARARRYARSFFAGASHEELDKQGRISVPQNLRDYADLGKDVAVLGVSDHIEIWSADEWNRLSNEADEYYANIEEALTDDDI